MPERDCMKWLSLQTAIAGTSGLAVVYLTSLVLGAPLSVVLCLLWLAMIATVFMVLRILKDPYSTDKTFDDYFYSDREDLRPRRPPYGDQK
jgi:hypothetical protein